MKKNTMMRIASVLLVAAILSTCAISGTFAKYTSGDSGTQTARVAKWGIGTATVAFDDLFSATYVNDEDATTVNGGSNEVIAPGTSGSATFTFEPAEGATTEVAYSLTVDTEGSTCATDIQNNPNITWTLDNVKCDDWNDLLADIEAKSVSANATTISGTVAWNWAFETAGDDAQDATDTAMGNAGDATVNLVIKVTATQIN